MPIKIAINGRFLDRPITGVERFGRETIWKIGELVSADDISVRDYKFSIIRQKSSLPHFHPSLPEVRIGPFKGHIWEQIVLPIIARDIVLINLCNFSPLLHTRSITCVHDAHVWLVPENFSNGFKFFYKFLLPRVIRKSWKWTTVSEYSASSLQFFGVSDRSPDAITYNSADSLMEKEKSRVFAKEIGKDYLFCLGSRSHNKNFSLIESIAPDLAARGFSVIAAGGNNSSVFRESKSASNGIIYLGRVSDGELSYLYENAFAFLFPSFYEGFGVPPLEAMSFGCPVIASNTSAMPEILGDSAILLPPTEPLSWISAIENLRDNPEIRRKYVGLGRERAASYRWRDTAMKFIDLID